MQSDKTPMGAIHMQDRQSSTSYFLRMDTSVGCTIFRAFSMAGPSNLGATAMKIG